MKKQTSLSSPTNENLFASPTNGTNGHTTKYSNQDDLFGLDLNNINPTVNGSHNNGHSSSANDDLLMLSGANPFIQNIVNQSYSNTNPVNPFQSNGFLNNFLQFKKKFLIYV
jgi:hypothetical protein